MSGLRELLERHVAEGVVPGAVGVLSRGDDITTVAVGAATPGGEAMREDAIVRIQSMTKVVTAVAALRLVEDGRLTLDADVTHWLPELADRRVLRDPNGRLDDTVAAVRPVRVRHLLTNTSGYGMVLDDSPLQRAMHDNGTEAGSEPPGVDATEWLQRLAELPLTHQPGEGWRYHHSFALLGILLSRLSNQPLDEQLRENLFDPLGMPDTGLWVSPGEAHRLLAAYRHGADGLVETEPAGGGFYATRPPFDVAHGELVSTAADYHRFLRALVDGRLVSADHLAQLSSDQVADEAKTPGSFFPRFWDGKGWGYGVMIKKTDPGRGRWGWSGGLGTDFFVDPDGTIAILMTQTEMGERMWPLITEFQTVA